MRSNHHSCFSLYHGPPSHGKGCLPGWCNVLQYDSLSLSPYLLLGVPRLSGLLPGERIFVKQVMKKTDGQMGSGVQGEGTSDF